MVGLQFAESEVVLLSAVVATGAGAWFKLPKSKIFSISGITTATVAIEYRTGSSGPTETLVTTTSDAAYSNNDALVEVRANVTAWTAGTITVTAGAVDA